MLVVLGTRSLFVGSEELHHQASSIADPVVLGTREIEKRFRFKDVGGPQNKATIQPPPLQQNRLQTPSPHHRLPLILTVPSPPPSSRYVSELNKNSYLKKCNNQVPVIVDCVHLKYLTLTRPDINYAVQQAYGHMHAPKTDHWNALKRIIWHVQGTTSFGLLLGSSRNPNLMAYTNAAD
ncbi:uncharacterized protein LOC110907399 [Helianthus annuus]|uniref:uncharacterized protein LOC110907399 n=1 Tax=Helianthus annuus TaxID=4232 RepID=UPI000B8EE9A2|nr:uncharacterized protein LOC110907399 [Helianthus annuus]